MSYASAASRFEKGIDTIYIENETTFKTKPCFDFIKNSNCKRGIMCWYAHGSHEIRSKDMKLEKYMREVFLPKNPKIRTWELLRQQKDAYLDDGRPMASAQQQNHH